MGAALLSAFSALLLLCVVASGSRVQPAGFACRRAWQSASENRGEDGVARAYRFQLEQSVESKWLGASDSITDADLLKLTAHDVVGAYAVVRGSVTVRRVCTGASGKSATYRAEITHVRVVCDNSKEHHAECMSKFAPLELMSPTFWYEQSLRSGSILRTVVPSTDPDVVDNFKASLIDVLGLTEGNCSVRGGREFNIVERLGGHHGHERPMRFHSMRVHNMAFGKDALASTSSRAVYALDVHGKTRSGRAAPHHFVHSSVDLKLVNVSNVNHSDRKFEDCSSIAARAREEEPTAATTLLETSASSHRTETSRRHREQTELNSPPVISPNSSKVLPQWRKMFAKESRKGRVF